MALTNAQVREILSAAGVSTENVGTAVQRIMEGHLASVNALREERDGYKVDAEKLPEVQKELDKLKAKGDQDWQQKYTDEHTAFEGYKKQIADEKALAEKSSLYRELLRDAKVEEKRIDSIMKVTDLSQISVKDGKLEGADALKNAIKSEWSGFIIETKEQGSKVDNPPASGGPTAFEAMSLAEKMKFANEHPSDQTVMDWLKK